VALAYKTPGVYRETVFVRPQAQLPTGVPGFVGCAHAIGTPAVAPLTPVPLQRPDDFTTAFTSPADGYLEAAVQGFFANGGARCYVVAVEPAELDEAALIQAIDALAPVTDLDLVAVPDAMTLEEHAAQRVQYAALAHCSEHGNRFAILDAPGGKDPNDPQVDAVEDVRAWAYRFSTGTAQPADAALYYPWVKVAVKDPPSVRAVPPCGHVAGVFARSDARVGVFKAPANEELMSVVDLEFGIDTAMQDRLNPGGVNCLRAFPGRGLRVWGARTLSTDANWRYINVRRLFLTLVRWVDRNLAWAAFEPNTPRLWLRIQRELNVYLGQLWQAGALKGASAAEAFYVKCDAETNPADQREQGQVTTEIGLSAGSPAEFVVVRIIQRAGVVQLS